MNVADTINAMLASGDLHGSMHADQLGAHGDFRLYLTAALAKQGLRLRLDGADGPLRGVRPLRAGHVVHMEGAAWRFVGYGESHVLLVHMTSAQDRSMPVADFDDAIAAGTIVPSDGAEGDLPPEARDRLAIHDDKAYGIALMKTQVVLAWRGRPDAGKRRPEGRVREYLGHPVRTIQHWGGLFDEAERKWGWGVLGLLEKPNLGNTSPRIDEIAAHVMNEVIDAQFLDARGINEARAYSVVLTKLRARGIPADKLPSAEAFHLQIARRSEHDVVAARRGHRAAYTLSDQFFEGRGPLPKHGLYPWHIVHVDSTQLPVELLDIATGRSLGRPWMHVAIDAFSRRILALRIGFEPPSHRSTMDVIDEMVWLHRRAPDYLVHDQGKEFMNRHVAEMCGKLFISDKIRPAAEPRFGSIIERLIGSIQTMVTDFLSGNSKFMQKGARQVTKSVDPKVLRTWDLLGLAELLNEFATDLYDNRIHPTTLATPRERYENGMRLAGERPMQTVPYDDVLRMAILPAVDRGGTRRSRGETGVKVGEVHYRHPLLNHGRVKGKLVGVKPDPRDATQVYVYIPLPSPLVAGSKGHWVTATARLEGIGRIEYLTRRELAIESARLRANLRKKREHAVDFEIALADYLLSHEERARRTDAAAKARAEASVRTILRQTDRSVPQAMAASSPEPPPFDRSAAGPQPAAPAPQASGQPIRFGWLRER